MPLSHLVQQMQRLSAEMTQSKGATVPGLFIYRSDQPTKIDAMIYEPIVCLIVQGQKQTTIGDETVRLQAGQYVVVGHDLPVLASITQASARNPYLSLIIRLDLELLRSLGDVLDEFEFESEAPRSLEVALADPALLDVLGRTLALTEDPMEAKVLLPLIKRELHYRLLRAEAGGMLRALANRDSQASTVGQAIEVLRRDFRAPLEVAGLARSVGMSASSFHRHFKAMTRTTPLQYQKDLRLTEARRLLRTGRASVSSAAFEVGYESPSQFSREYSRKFGSSPRADRELAASAALSVSEYARVGPAANQQGP